MFKLPAVLTAERVSQILPIFDEWLSLEPGSWLAIDCSETTFIDPFCLCIFAEIVQKLKTHEVKGVLQGLPKGLRNYLDRMDFFQSLEIEYESDRQRNERLTGLVELTKIQLQKNIDSEAAKLTRALIGDFDDFDPKALPDENSGLLPYDNLERTVKYLMTEALLNSLSHGKRGSKNSYVWTALQYYPKTDNVNLSVVDNGVGFLRTLSSHPDLGDQTHEDALNLAMQPHKSCNRDQWLKDGKAANLGLGLTVISDLVCDAGGKMTVMSGDALLALENKSHKYVTIPHWQGVAISIIVPRSTLREVALAPIIRKYQDDIGEELITFT